MTPGIRLQPGQIGRVAVEGGESVLLARAQVRRRFAAFHQMPGDREPLDALGVARHGLGQLRLRDGRHGIAVVGEVLELRPGRARVGGDGDGAEPCAGKPEEFHLRRIVEVHQHVVAGLDAALVQARRYPQHAIAELAVGPSPPFALERLPDQERMVAPRLGAEVDQPIDIAPGERIDERPRVLGKCGHGNITARRTSACAARSRRRRLP